MGNTIQTRIFLSSTYTDLSAIRTMISQWLIGVFGTDLIIMETFGSDAAPPDVNSVRRVRDCDLFIGIYAHRYGTVNQATGKSIVDLELDEAKRAFSSPFLRTLLLAGYLLHIKKAPANYYLMRPAPLFYFPTTKPSAQVV